ncbi:MAG: 5-formyltetrahydrofolate cyclo-ligase [Verrucomicrobia bacterium]|nr:5-formyltetrahydrofolate cyclo-ligase [Verrucomicrobiota bacterium]
MSATHSHLAAEKRALRERVLALRGALSSEEVSRRSRLVAARLLELPAVRQAEAIFCYLSHKNEVETRQLVGDWLVAGKHIHVPAYHAEQRRYQPSHIRDLERDLAAGKLGILEPHTRRMPDRPADIAIVPGVAFDAQGHRLGYGKGFYDEMLKHFAGLKIALAFDCQMLAVTAHGDNDVPMDVVVTEGAIYWREHT